MGSTIHLGTHQVQTGCIPKWQWYAQQTQPAYIRFKQQLVRGVPRPHDPVTWMLTSLEQLGGLPVRGLLGPDLTVPRPVMAARLAKAELAVRFAGICASTGTA